MTALATVPRRRSGRETAQLRRLATLITGDLGIQLPDSKLTMLRGRLQRRLNHLGLESLVAYEERLKHPRHAHDEKVALFDLATTNKTDFFREPAHFNYLTETALPALSARGDRWTCRVWCAGCSTGQEVYTLAMVLDDYARRHPGFDFQITGTDISTRVLREAHAATYDATLVEPVPIELRQRYLLRGKGARAGQVRVVKALRHKIELQRLNFMDEHYPIGEVDIIFFRNVMIYFDKATQQRVLSKMATLLARGGYLFIGHTESAAGLKLPLTVQASSVLRRTT